MMFAVATPASFAAAQVSSLLLLCQRYKKEVRGTSIPRALVALGALVSLGRVTIPTEKIGNLQ